MSGKPPQADIPYCSPISANVKHIFNPYRVSPQFTEAKGGKIPYTNQDVLG
jgi:hypothetical protein